MPSLVYNVGSSVTSESAASPAHNLPWGVHRLFSMLSMHSEIHQASNTRLNSCMHVLPHPRSLCISLNLNKPLTTPIRNSQSAIDKCPCPLKTHPLTRISKHDHLSLTSSHPPPCSRPKTPSRASSAPSSPPCSASAPLPARPRAL